MKLRSLLLTLPVLALLSSPDASRAGEPAFPPDALATWTAMEKVQTLEATFRQVRTSRILLAPLVSTGTIRYQRPDRLAWVMETPARSVMVMKGTTVGMAWPDLGTREEVDLAGNEDAARLVESMMIWLGGDLDKVQRDFTMAWTSGNPARCALTPTNPVMKAILARLDLVISGDPPLVRQVTLTEPDGDKVIIDFDHIRPDAALAPNAFELPGP